MADTDSMCQKVDEDFSETMNPNGNTADLQIIGRQKQITC